MPSLTVESEAERSVFASESRGTSGVGREGFLSLVKADTQEREDCGTGGAFSDFVLLRNDLSLSKDRLVDGLDSIEVALDDFLDTGLLLDV